MDLSALEVLIVDDHPVMREMLRKALERAGARAVRAAASGAEALAELEARGAHLILVDQNMPGMTGAQFTARVRERGDGTRIIMITGDARAESAGADALLVKPVSPREVLSAIERVLSA